MNEIPQGSKHPEKPLSEINVRGYTALVQEIFLIGIKYGKQKELLRNNTELDPFKTLRIDRSKTRSLVDSVEAALSTLFPRGQRAIRIHFGLDRSNNSKFLTLEEVGKELKDLEQKKPITKERTRIIIKREMRLLRHPTRSRKIANTIWGDNPIPYLAGRP